MQEAQEAQEPKAISQALIWPNARTNPWGSSSPACGAQVSCGALHDAPAVSGALALHGGVCGADGNGRHGWVVCGLGLRLVWEHGFTTGVRESCRAGVRCRGVLLALGMIRGLNESAGCLP